jgi:hypothetical protein
VVLPQPPSAETAVCCGGGGGLRGHTCFCGTVPPACSCALSYRLLVVCLCVPVCACVCCSLPLPTARARFVRALIWANPVYLQAIGKILYENTTDDVRPVPRCRWKELRVWCCLSSCMLFVLRYGLFD